MSVAHEHGHELGFFRKYIFSRDHKIIGIQFLFTSLIFLFLGGLLALGVRSSSAGRTPTSRSSASGFGADRPAGKMPPDIYNMLFTMHATVMIFFVIIPLLTARSATS